MELHQVPNKTYIRVLPQLEYEDKREVSEAVAYTLKLDISKDAKIPPSAPMVKRG